MATDMGRSELAPNAWLNAASRRLSERALSNVSKPALTDPLLMQIRW